ncbi:MAG: ABC transporter substrate-binding protein, partial [Candidatus Adiutrix sp.]|nr:ABC transporter substrate-binding protein [Candidatus Adiutrix sp.]
MKFREVATIYAARLIAALILLAGLTAAPVARAEPARAARPRPAAETTGGQVFRAIYPRAPLSLDPHAEPDPAAWPVIMAAYDRLLTLAPGTAQPKPALARQIRVSDNGLIYTFHIFEGLTFADGTLVNAEAILYSFDRLMATPAGRRYFPYLERFEHLGEYTFRLILSRPWPPFLASLALPPASIVSPGLRHQPPDYLFAHTLGSGLYQMHGWKDDTLGLAARPDLANKPSVSLALFHYEPDPQARCQKMIAHGAHLTVEPDCGTMTRPGRFRIRPTPSFSVRFLALNTRRPYTRLQNVRRALSAVVGAAFQDRPGRLEN